MLNKKKSVFVATKPKSAIDDLFADVDSDDIFSPKNTVTKNKYSSNNNQSANSKNVQKKYLETVTATNNMATSTPEADVNTTNLFNDDEDVSDLFGSSKNPQLNKKVGSRKTNLKHKFET